MLALACGAATAQRKGLLDGLEAEGPQGERGSQPVAGADTSAELELVLLPQGERTQVGQPFRFDVMLVGDPVRDAADVRIEIGATIRRGQAQAPATELRVERAVAQAGAGQPETPCAGTGDMRTCDIVLLPAKGGVKASITILTRAGVAPGKLVLTARALAGGAQRAVQEATVDLVERARLSNVGLTIAIKTDADVAAPGLDIGNVVHVRNTSATENATEVVVQIRQRIIVSEAEGFKRLPDGGYSTTGRREGCEWKERTYRCTLGTLAAGAETQIPLETKVSADLPARRWGRLETQARVKSAEDDPDPGDNLARQVTNVISRQPVLAFISRNGRGVYLRQDALGNGQVFSIAARYPHVLVEPGELVVQLRVGNAAPTEVRLRPSADSRERVYRSDPFVLMAPQDNADAGRNVALRAARGSVLKVTHGTSETVVRVE